MTQVAYESEDTKGTMYQDEEEKISLKILDLQFLFSLPLKTASMNRILLCKWNFILLEQLLLYLGKCYFPHS